MWFHHRPRRGTTECRINSRFAEPLEARTLLAAEFVADLNPYTAASNPQQFVALGEYAYFVAKSGTGDTFGLYRTDGTPTGTVTVADGLVNPTALSAAGGRLYFWASDPAHGVEPWTSDGTAAGTTLLKDTAPGTASGRVFPLEGPSNREFVEFDGKVFFTQGHFSFGNLWVTDGTAEGTQRFGTTGYYPAWDMAVMGDHLYYLRSSETHGVGGLWRTDGTVEGTALVVSYRNCTNLELHSLTVVGDTLFFAAPWFPGAAVASLWKSDGTAEGTVAVQGERSSEDALNPADLTVAGGTPSFTAGQNSAQPRYLWASDGTAAGTARVVTGDAAPREPQRLHALPAGGVAFAAFSVRDSNRDWELWRSDGTAAGTALVKDIWPGTGDGSFQTSIVDPRNLEFERLGSFLYFAADDGVSGRELWRTDGTTEGTARVVDLAAGPRSSNPGGPPPVPVPWASPKAGRANAIAVAGGRLVFSAAGDPDDYEPWATDGTGAPAVRLADLNQTARGSNPRNMAAFGGELLVASDLGSTERRLFRSDGTAAGTTSFSGVAPAQTYPGVPGNGFGIVNGVAYYAGEPAGVELTESANRFIHRTDGTAAGTAALPGLLARGPSSQPNPVTAVNGIAYFTALRLRPEGGSDFGLWRSDPGPEGALLLLSPGLHSGGRQFGSFSTVTPAGGLGYFFTVGSGSASLWRTDGTEQGTVELTPQGTPSWSGLTAAVGARFFAALPTGGMLVSDGTPAGTHLVPNVTAASNVVAFDGAAYFAVTGAHPTGGGSGPALFRTDGTAAGTRLVRHISSAANGPAPAGLSVVGDSLYFRADDGVYGYEPWVSDGTEAGTRMAADVRPGPAGSRHPLLDGIERYPAFIGAGGRAYFSADDGTHGAEPWSTDGTAAGTRMEGDVYPGAVGSDPSVPVAAGGSVYFAATDVEHGRELWKVTPSAAVAGRYVFYNDSALDGRDGGAGATDDAAVAADKQALRPGEAAGAANVTGYTRGINGVMIDLAGLPQGVILTTDDFEFRARRGGGSGWATGPTPREVAVRRGAGASGAERVTLVWDDASAAGSAHRAMADGWLEVTVKANDRTGLSSPDTFRFGNLRGDTGGAGWTRVDAVDYVRTRAAIGSRVAPSSPFDHNRDGRVNVLDLVAVRQALFNTLVPVEETDTVAASSAAPRLPLRRGAYGVL